MIIRIYKTTLKGDVQQLHSDRIKSKFKRSKLEGRMINRYEDTDKSLDLFLTGKTESVQLSKIEQARNEFKSFKKFELPQNLQRFEPELGEQYTLINNGKNKRYLLNEGINYTERGGELHFELHDNNLTESVKGRATYSKSVYKKYIDINIDELPTNDKEYNNLVSKFFSSVLRISGAEKTAGSHRVTFSIMVISGEEVNRGVLGSGGINKINLKSIEVDKVTKGGYLLFNEKWFAENKSLLRTIINKVGEDNILHDL